MNAWNRECLESQLDTNFELRAAGLPPLSLRLVEVADIGRTGMEGFSLLFRGPAAPVLRHDTHALHHPVLGETALFIGPVQTGRGGGVHYEAVFSVPQK